MKADFKAIQNGLIFDQSTCMYPSRLIGHVSGEQSFTEEFTHTFGFVHDGQLKITYQNGIEITLVKGMHISVAGAFKISGTGSACLFQRIGFRGLTQFGGPVEKTGRLGYIDNCMNSILVSPPRVGDPVLNLLSFPPNVNQTLHVHPSIRLGTVVSGEGVCVSPGRPEVPLQAGKVFILEEAYPHNFRSFDNGMLIIAYHPDSDVGPSDQQNPMLSRTYREF
ncbi:MAG: hypothetical protein KF681_07465 [Bdellovibrionaceae bacterium]|nr:hypothetical protein [Pseudobdellovibrionaceae bacterium]